MTREWNVNSTLFTWFAYAHTALDTKEDEILLAQLKMIQKHRTKKKSTRICYTHAEHSNFRRTRWIQSTPNPNKKNLSTDRIWIIYHSRMRWLCSCAHNESSPLTDWMWRAETWCGDRLCTSNRTRKTCEWKRKVFGEHHSWSERWLLAVV